MFIFLRLQSYQSIWSITHFRVTLHHLVFLIFAISSSSEFAIGQAQPCYYLYPYNMHLVVGQTSSQPLVVKDSDGNLVNGPVIFKSYDGTLIRIKDGYVTALRNEGINEIGTLVQATINGIPMCNRTIVRVHSIDHDLKFIEDNENNVTLLYPEKINNVDLKQIAHDNQISLTLELSYSVQKNYLNLYPFRGCRQIVEVDVGETPTSTVCGLAGNPFRLGWNINGANCFIMLPSLIPHWFVFFHEMGHNFAGASSSFNNLLGSFVYGEGFASILAVLSMEHIVKNSSSNGINEMARGSLSRELNAINQRFSSNFGNWLQGGASFSKLDPDIVDGIYLNIKKQSGSSFDERLFYPLQFAIVEGTLSPISQVFRLVSERGMTGKHNFFAALMSFAAEKDLSKTFSSIYHYPIDEELFKKILNCLECWDITITQKTNVAVIYKKPYTATFDAKSVNGDDILFIDSDFSDSFVVTSDGTVNGIANEFGVFSIEFEVENEKSGGITDFTLPIVVQVDSCSEELLFYDPYLRPAEINKRYYARINCYNKTKEKITYSVLNGPDWLKITSGYLDGIPDRTGSFPIRIKAESKNSQTHFKDFELAVYDPADNKMVLSIFIEGNSTLKNQLCINGYVFSDSGIENGMTFDWGDGCITSGWFPQTHLYSLPGFYHITVGAEDKAGKRMETAVNHSVKGFLNHAPKPAKCLPDLSIAAAFKTSSGILLQYHCPGVTRIFIEADDGYCGVGKTFFNLYVLQSDHAKYSAMGFANGIKVAPNPFSEWTSFEFELVSSSFVELIICDVSGRTIARLIDHEFLSPGKFGIKWYGFDQHSNICQPGVYIVKLISGTGQASAKFNLVL